MKRVIQYIHAEISTLCNAACPCCPRFLFSSPVIAPGLEPGYISFKNFKKFFPPSILGRTKIINFCGNHGDPGTNPDLYEILKYCSQFNELEVQMHTNGGMKAAKYWDKIGKLAQGRKNWKIIFSIDGISDTNHIYRRNVKWDKLEKNIEVLGKYACHNDGKTGFHFIWEYLVFEHNQHQLEEATDLARDFGFTSIAFKRPLNVDDGVNPTAIAALNSAGEVEYWIKPTTLKAYKPPYIKDSAKIVYDHTLKKHNTTLINAVNKTKGPPLEQVYFSSKELIKEQVELANESKIVPLCQSQEYYVEASGQVHKCCFVATGYDAAKKLHNLGHQQNEALRQYVEKMLKLGNKLNLNYTDFETIVKDKTVQKLYDREWDKTVEEGKLMQCVNYCGSNNTQEAITSIFNSPPTKKNRI